MKSTFKVLWIIALVAVIGFSFAACSGDDSNVDPALNGSWANSGRVWIFNNGNWEFRIYGNPNSKGTYTTSSDNIKMIITHLPGSLLPNSLGANKGNYYTKAEIKALYEAKGEYNDIAAQWLDESFAPETYRYYVSDGGLIWIWSSEQRENFFKQP